MLVYTRCECTKVMRITARAMNLKLLASSIPIFTESPDCHRGFVRELIGWLIHFLRPDYLEHRCSQRGQCHIRRPLHQASLSNRSHNPPARSASALSQAFARLACLRLTSDDGREKAIISIWSQPVRPGGFRYGLRSFSRCGESCRGRQAH